MRILERHVHTVSNAAAYWEREAAFKAVEDRLGGFPQKTYYSLLSGTERIGTIVHQREWESFAAMEAAYERLWAEPGIEDLAASGPEGGNTERLEFYSSEEPR